MNYEQGSIWRKWDLHIHTPSSMVHHYEGKDNDEKWENFLRDLEALPPECKVIGINDYLFIDGYEKVLEFKKAGRLQNIETIFPVIEFRIKKFGGHRAFKRVNFHIIFSDELTPDIIKHQFLSQLSANYKLSPDADSIQWGGVVTPDSLADLGRAIKASVPPENLPQYDSDLVEGFNNINFDEERILEILNKSTSYLKGKFLTAVGKTEWESFEWGESSIAEKKNVINNADFVFTSAENILSFNKAKLKLANDKVNSLLLDCSDSHRNSSSTNKDRIGKCFTWIKADTTFEGLKQVINEPERIIVADRPVLLERLTVSPNKFIKALKIKRVEDSSMPETWFDKLEIPLNPSLVAIIGNKGNGKSAVADIIGIVGNSYNTNYSFLTRRKFRSPHPFNRAANTEAQLVWHDGTVDGFHRLSDEVDFNRIEKVKYIPQNFLETLCDTEEENKFENEIKNIIFSHTQASERLGFSNLDELIAYKSEVINREIGNIKSDIEDINIRIINLERKAQDGYKRSTQEMLSNKKSELENHKLLKPQTVTEPTNNGDLAEKNKSLNGQVAELKSSIEQKEKRKVELNRLKTTSIQAYTDLEKALQAIRALREDALSVYQTYKPILEKHGIDIMVVMPLKFEFGILEQIIREKRSEVIGFDYELNGNGSTLTSIDFEIAKLRENLSALEQKLDEPFRVYQKFIKDLQEWASREKQIIGTKDDPGTLEYLNNHLSYLETQLERDINSELNERNLLLRKLFDKKQELIGIEDGNRVLSDLVAQFDLNNSSGLIDFLQEIRENLFFDQRLEKDNKREIEQQLKKGYSVEDLYRFLYTLDYLKPTFRLNLGTKSLSELSPGERGALLLIFYLLLDKDDKPLIIDQPEENLDNQSVYKYLVHFIKEAKNRRQIIIVTHNPNLAVVCDAEQIVHMSIDKARSNTVYYLAGAIENGDIKTRVVDILEGTKPAFSNRTSKYSLT
ncbi:MAG: DNA repair protein [Proteobacteria bacterium]|nr:MAG: DNA repair protein [Pseudomonadota bacterium]